MTDPERNYFDPPDLHRKSDRLHPMWSFILMYFCIAGALIVGVYALTSDYTGFGAVVVGALLMAAVLVYRTS